MRLSNKTNKMGWAVAALLLIGIIWLLTQNNQLEEINKNLSTKNTLLTNEQQLTERELAENKTLLNIIRSKDFKSIALVGNQAVSPQSFAKIYFNKQENLGYVDSKGLPSPPKGKAYQLWSLKMEPFEATPLGLLNKANKAGENLYSIPNFSERETLCITLEPEEGSKTPTMSQIYVMKMDDGN